MIRKVFNINNKEQEKINKLMQEIANHKEFELRSGTHYESTLVRYLINTYEAFDVDKYIESLPLKNKNDRFLRKFINNNKDYYKKYKKKRGNENA